MSVTSIDKYRERVRSLENDPRFAAEEMKLAFADDLVRLLEARGLRRTELAAKLGTNRGYITRVLNTEYNLTVETMARIAQALGAQVSIHLHPAEARTQWFDLLEQPSLVVPGEISRCWTGKCEPVFPQASSGTEHEESRDNQRKAG